MSANGNEYTPETDEVRRRYVYVSADLDAAPAEFDRWLASVKAEAWDECMLAVEANAWIDWAIDQPLANPYRADELEGK